MLRFLSSLCVAVAVSFPAAAAPVDDLLRALRLGEMLDIMRTEGLTYGEEMAQDMFPAGNSAGWDAFLSRLYDIDRMQAAVEAGFVETLDDTEVAPLVTFFTSDLGRNIVSAELDARRTLVDDDVEEAARETYRLRDTDDADARLAQLRDFVDANDLLEANVAGALNASFQFYRGLADGGALVMSESEMISDVWAQEDDTRTDTREWLFAYLLLAYDDLADEAMDDYIALSRTDEGRAMNRALFAGFNAMYDDISYALGLAAAEQMLSQEGAEEL